MQTFGSPGISRGKASKVQAGPTRKMPNRQEEIRPFGSLQREIHPPNPRIFLIKDVLECFGAT